MTTFNLVEEVEKALKAGIGTGTIKGEIILTKGKIPFDDVELKLKEIAESLVLKTLKTAKLLPTGLPTGYLEAIALIETTFKDADEKIIKLFKDNWIGDFPKVDNYTWIGKKGKYGKLLNALNDNLNFTIEEYETHCAKELDTAKSYAKDIIKFTKDFQKIDPEVFAKLFKE